MSRLLAQKGKITSRTQKEKRKTRSRTQEERRRGTRSQKTRKKTSVHYVSVRPLLTFHGYQTRNGRRTEKINGKVWRFSSRQIAWLGHRRRSCSTKR